MSRKIETSDKIIKAAAKLFSSKGYEQTSTKEIATEAGVSEMTIFRHFKTKDNLMDELFEKLVFIPNFEDFFHNKISHNLRIDLLMMGKLFANVAINNIIPLRINMTNFNLSSISNNSDPLKQFPNRLKQLMVEYLEEMKRRGEFEGDPERFSILLLSSCFGIIFSLEVIKSFEKEGQLEEYLEDFFKIFLS